MPARPKPKATAYFRTAKESSFQSDVIQAAKVNGWSITLPDVTQEHHESSTEGCVLKQYLSRAYIRPHVALAMLRDFLLRRRGHTFALAYHTHDSRRSQKGFPDLVLVHPRRGLILFVELKRHGQYPTIEQRLWRAALLCATHGNDGHTRYFLWTPDDWDEVVTTLGGLNPRTLG